MRVLLMMAVLSALACGCSGAGGSTDGGPGDAGASDGGALDAGALDSGVIDGGAPDGGARDGGVSDGGALDGGAADGGSADAGPPRCSLLDVTSCRARSDCVADFCFACTCAPTFAGCRDVQAPAFQCPAVECAQPECCRAPADCTGGVCVAPGDTFNLCGACNTQAGTCTSDADCQGFAIRHICEPITCSCSAERVCVPGCASQGTCAQGTTCSAVTGRCEATSCTTNAGCPAMFTCAAGACARKSCTTDAACGDGFCVEGQCYDSWGRCALLPP